MVKIKLKYGLPFCSIDIKHKGRILTLDNILIDTGSGGTILKMDEVSLGEFKVNDFKVEIGVMDYGFNINGIIGVNFLKEINAVIDLKDMIIKYRKS